MTNPILTATGWAGGGLLAGAAAGALLMLPFRPRDPQGFEDLGWWLMTLAVAALLALVVGAVALHRGLRGHGHRGATVLVFLPLAVLLAGISAGVGALLAAPLARWAVELVARRRQPAATAYDGVGWGGVSRG